MLVRFAVVSVLAVLGTSVAGCGSSPATPLRDAPVVSDGPIDGLPIDAAIDALIADAFPGCVLPPAYTPPTPASVGIPATGLAAWIRADMGLSIDGASRVCGADDLSGAGHHFTQLTENSRPSVGTVGGHPAIVFTDAKALEHDGVFGIAATSPRTIIAAVQLDSTTARGTVVFQGAPGTAGTFLGPESNTFMTVGSRWGAYLTGNAYDGQVATSTAPTITAYSLDAMTVGAPILDHLSARVNGVDLTLTRTAGGGGDTTIESFAAATRTWLGWPTAVQAFRVAEVLAWSRALTAVELGQVEAYLAGRYGITL